MSIVPIEAKHKKTRFKHAIYGALVFDVVEDDRSIYFLTLTIQNNKKSAPVTFVVDSKRCRPGRLDGQDVWEIFGVNSVKPF